MSEVLLGLAMVCGGLVVLVAFFLLGELVREVDGFALLCLALIFLGLCAMVGYSVTRHGDPPLWTIIVLGCGALPMLSGVMGDW